MRRSLILVGVILAMVAGTIAVSSTPSAPAPSTRAPVVVGDGRLLGSDAATAAAEAKVAGELNYYTAVALHRWFTAVAAARAAEAARARAPRGSCDHAIDYGPGGYDGRYQGTTVPQAVIDREAGGNYGSCNESSGACGKYQYLDSTWNGWGGYASACDAPPAVQDQRAQYDMDRGAACSNWNYGC